MSCFNVLLCRQINLKFEQYRCIVVVVVVAVEIRKWVFHVETAAVGMSPSTSHRLTAGDGLVACVDCW